uniref:Uncharacterized protein n=1 Tax=Parascaris equorum TaxID=6256 RepID=A0A914RMY7_PAREQ
MVQQELTAVTAHFTRIIEHNRATFGTLYGQLLKEAMSKRMGVRCCGDFTAYTKI